MKYLKPIATAVLAVAMTSTPAFGDEMTIEEIQDGYLKALSKDNAARREARRRAEDRIGKVYVIPGTCSFDVDTGRVCGDGEAPLKVNPKLSDYDIEFGASRTECDIWWQQDDSEHRRLVPMNGAEIYDFDVGFASPRRSELESAEFLQNPIDGSNLEGTSLPALMPNTRIGVRTNDGIHVYSVEGFDTLRNNKGYNLRIKEIAFFPNRDKPAAAVACE